MIGGERALCETLSRKMTNPIRSFDLPEIKSIATFLEASKRSGVRSCANILPEISMAKTMSIPSVVISSQEAVDCGRAKATIKSPIASVLKMKKRMSSPTLPACCL